jgi:DNA-binding NarL/FixJ family response regulator
MGQQPQRDKPAQHPEAKRPPGDPAQINLIAGKEEQQPQPQILEEHDAGADLKAPHPRAQQNSPQQLGDHHRQHDPSAAVNAARMPATAAKPMIAKNVSGEIEFTTASISERTQCRTLQPRSSVPAHRTCPRALLSRPLDEMQYPATDERVIWSRQDVDCPHAPLSASLPAMSATTVQSSRHPIGRSGPTTERRPLRVLVVDDDALLRSRMCTLIENKPGFHLSGIADTAEEALWMAENEPIDVVVASHPPKSRSGFWLCRELNRLAAPPAVVICSAHPDEMLAVWCAVAEADALVSRYDGDAELCRVLDRVGRGRRLLPSVPPPAGATLHDHLDPAERAIFSLLLAGIPSGDVAQALRISRSELEARRSTLLTKLQTLPRTSIIGS